MDSPLLQPVPTPKRMIVPGTHQAHGSWFTVTSVHPGSIVAYVGPPSDKTTHLNAAALRAYSVLYAELAQALEGK